MLEKYYKEDVGMYVIPYETWYNDISLGRSVLQLLKVEEGCLDPWVFEVRNCSAVIRRAGCPLPGKASGSKDTSMWLYSLDYLLRMRSVGGDLVSLVRGMLNLDIVLDGVAGNYAISVIEDSVNGDTALIWVIESKDAITGKGFVCEKKDMEG